MFRSRWTRPAVPAAGVLAAVLSLGAAAAASQAVSSVTPVCARTWVGREAEIEEHLRTAAVRRIEPVPVGVTNPKRAFFEGEGPVASIAWKPLAPGYRSGYWESYKSEIAAYELDKLLGLHMVPPAVERRIDGAVGAAIMWITPVKGWNMKHPVRGPEPEWSRQVSRMKLFDQLIANIDRNQGNLLYDDDWHLFLIDHSRAFTHRPTLSGVDGPSRIDRVMWERISALTREDLDRALGPWLDRLAIAAILERRELIHKEIHKNISRRGEAAVFFP